MKKAYCVWDVEKNEIAKDICGQYLIKPFKKDCNLIARRWNGVSEFKRYSVRKVGIVMRSPKEGER